MRLRLVSHAGTGPAIIHSGGEKSWAAVAADNIGGGGEKGGNEIAVDRDQNRGTVAYTVVLKFKQYDIRIYSVYNLLRRVRLRLVVYAGTLVAVRTSRSCYIYVFCTSSFIE